MKVNKMEQKKYLKPQLNDFCLELDRQAKTRIDYIAPTNTNELQMTTDGEKLFLNVPMNGSINRFPLTSYAEEQIASYYKLHVSYLRKMRTRGELRLICANINKWIPTSDSEKDKRLIRIVDSEVIAYLGPNYLCINNQQFVDKVMKHLDQIEKTNGMRWKLKRMDITENHLYLKITSPDLRDEVFVRDRKTKLQVGDVVEGGMITRNSETGDGSFITEPYTEVLRCTNGMIRTVYEDIYRRAHRGIEQEIGPYNYSSEYYTKTLDQTLDKLTQQIDKTFTSDLFHKWVERLNQKAQIPIPNPSVAIDNFINHFKLSESLKDIIAKQLEQEPHTDLWAIVSAATKVAQSRPNYEEQISIERAATQVMELNPLILTTERKKDKQKGD